MKRLACCVWVVVLPLLTGLSDCCDTSGCEGISFLVLDADIDQGFAGHGARPNTDCGPACCNCLVADFDVEILPVTEEPRTDDEAEAIYRAGFDDRLIVTMRDGRYEVAMAPGEYLLCSVVDDTVACRLGTVAEGAVTTAHVAASPAPTIDVFAPRGGEPDTRPPFAFSREPT